MLVDLVWQNVDDHLAKKLQPVIGLQREPENAYWVPNSLLSETIEWSVTKSGERALVPMYAYKTKSLDASTLFGLGLELGLRAASSFRDRPPSRIVLILGDCCHEDAAGISGYIGLAFITGVSE